jgi:hypothetical protein
MRIHAALSTAISFLFFITAPCTSHAASPKACDLLSSQMAVVLAGGPVTDHMDAGFLCLYPSDSAGTQVSLSVTNASASDADSYMQAKGGAGPGDAYESIPGLGDQNLFVVGANQKHSFIVFYHNKEVFLFVHRKMTPELKAAMIQAMKEIIPKI